MSELNERFEFAVSLIKQAGSFLLKHTEDRVNVAVKQENDYVTVADKGSEALIKSSVEARFPEDTVLGEETGEDKGVTEYRWVIDPIDGTVYFMNQLPLYCISIAIEQNETPVAGLVYNPCYDELFTAIKGEGAYLNGKRIYTNPETDLRRTLALVVPPHRLPERIPAFLEQSYNLLLNVSDLRSIGSAAMSLCYVASGRCSAYYESCLHYYDIAAATLIVSEAGGVNHLKEHEGEYIDILSSAAHFSDKLKEIIKW